MILFRVAGRALLALMIVGSILTTVPAHAAEVVIDEYYLPTVDGALVYVQVKRDKAFEEAGEKVPVILTYSPYNVLAGGDDIVTDGYADKYVPRGYARAVADVIGTRNSTGCWDYGGAKEQQSGVDLVNFLSSQPWSSGKVAMIGGSYDGTTATMVAARGDEVPGLVGIVPIAGISHWYGYAFYDGVRYFLNSRTPTDEGFDTPLAFDFALGRVPNLDPTDPNFQQALEDRLNPCDSIKHTQQGYSRSPDYTDFWLERDYYKDADDFRAAVLIAHGWQDYNVKQDEAIKLWSALPEDDPRTEDAVEGVPFKRMYLTQGTHSGATSGAAWAGLLERFFEQTLKGVDHGLEDEPAVSTVGRNVGGALPVDSPSIEVDWPPPATRDLTLHLGRSFDTIDGVPSVGPVGTTGETGTLELEPQDDGGGWTHLNPGTVTEEMTLRDPLNEDGHGYYSLYHKSEPLVEDTRLVGSAVLDTWVNVPVAGQTLTPILVEVAPDGTLTLVERGFLNLDYAGGNEKADPKTGWIHAQVDFLPQDYTFTAGNRIGLILQGSNTVWAVPGNPGVISYAMGSVPDVTTVGAHLILPTTATDPFGVGGAAGKSAFGRSHKKPR
jgi:X-Pro dipeptidyl-peptidase